MRFIRFLLVGISLLWEGPVYGWGFFAHQQINRLAIFSLPPEMVGFYKQHHLYLTESAVNPDKRRYVVKAEAPRHYIDLDVYGDSALTTLPKFWVEAVKKYGDDSLLKHGIVPWHLNLVKYALTQAFKQHDIPAILQLSADIGHYVADACVPLHTTRNYNGQLTNQQGIHGLWESRLPELLAGQYDYFVGPAVYLKNPQLKAWDLVSRSYAALDSVFRFEKEASNEFSADKKYALEERGATTVKTYSPDFSKVYHAKLKGQVERQMRFAILNVSSFWYTCWVDAGQPDLRNMQPLTEAQKKALAEEDLQLKPVLVPDRSHELD